MKKQYLIFSLASILIVIDQITKLLIRLYLPEGESIPVLQGIFHLTHTRNTGAAFSLMTGHTGVLTVISLLAIIIISIYVIKRKAAFTPAQSTGWALLLGGTAGNFIDRISLGGVTDFFDLAFINFPIFNFADIFIDTGALILIVMAFMDWRNEQQTEKRN
jgi:signal peptidase II